MTEEETKARKPAKTPFYKRSLSFSNVLVALLLVGTIAYIGGTRSDELFAKFGGSSNPTQLDVAQLNSVYDVLRANYDGKIDSQALVDGAKRGMIEATGDPYSQYFTTKEAETFENDLEGSFQGIGAELGKRADRLVVISTLDDSPAKKSGLLAGDIIVAVNEEDAAKWSIEKAVSKIRGEKNTTVKLTIFRGDQPKDFTITREAINNPSVKSEILEGNIGFLRISRFGETDTATLSQKAAESFKAAGVKAVILDLRGNGGGYLGTSGQVSSLWLEDKVVVTQRSNGKVVDTLRSGNYAPLKGIKTFVLVDGGSASASEIVAGALIDNNAATLVGEKTFGKGSVQVIKPVASGGMLKVTTAKWYTPKGKNISKEGIKPTVEVKMTAEDVNAGRDLQKDKAIELAQ